MIIIDNGLLFSGMLKNPGIPQRIFDNFLKQQCGKGKDVLAEGDIEAVTQNTKRARKEQKEKKYGTHFCQDCNIWKDNNTIHCEDCQVCVEGYDHHCIFFGKCIGGGNII